MVGEIREKETAHHLFEAAQAGHLILATMHAKNIVGAISRLQSWGINGSILNNSLLGILGQRLIRKNCPDCVTDSYLTEEEAKMIFQQPEEIPQDEYNHFITKITSTPIKKSTGKTEGHPCYTCEASGYFGRLPISEIYVHKMEYWPIILDICREHDNGLVDMYDLFTRGEQLSAPICAVDNLFAGITSPKEILRLPRSYFADYKKTLYERAQTKHVNQ